MSLDRRWWCLIALLGMLAGTQQFFFWSRRLAAESLLAAQQTHLARVRQENERTASELIESGRLWTGPLHGHSEAALQDTTNNTRDTTQRRLALGRLKLEESTPRFTANLEIHECDPHSQTCATGGSITLLDNERLVCRISISLLQSQGQPSNFEVAWASNEHEAGTKLALVKRLCGDGPLPDRDTFQRLLQAAYAEGQNSFEHSVNSHKAALVRAVLRAICASQDLLQARNQFPAAPAS